MLPLIVYAPAYPDPREGHDGVRFETRMLTTGEVVGIGFSDLPTLVAALGPAQPWVALPLEQLEQTMGAAGLRRILVDPELPDDALRWTDEDLSALVAARHGDLPTSDRESVA